jgi:hypothetical protein
VSLRGRVARGARSSERGDRRVVDDEEHHATVVASHELLQELEEGGVVAQPAGVSARLSPDSVPRAMQTAVLPEAGLVLSTTTPRQ